MRSQASSYFVEQKPGIHAHVICETRLERFRFAGMHTQVAKPVRPPLQLMQALSWHWIVRKNSGLQENPEIVVPDWAPKAC